MVSRRIMLASFTVIAVLGLAWLIFIREAGTPWATYGETMGTTYNIQISDCPTDCETLDRSIASRLTELNQALSHYDAESELSAFNRYAGTDWIPVSPDLYNVVAYARVLSRQNNGAFDITLAPVIELWGFSIEQNDQLPPAKNIHALMEHAGYLKLAVQHDPKALRKSDPALQVNLSAIAKGYAVDQLAAVLETAGITDYLIEIGGEIRANGKAPGGRPWRIGIEPPDEKLEIEFVISPENTSVASSGDYRNYFMVDGKRYSHTIDPRTGWPVEHGLAAVSVVLPSATQADALATALMVMGPEEGLRHAEENGIPALFFVREEKGLVAFHTRPFANYLLRY